MQKRTLVSFTAMILRPLIIYMPAQNFRRKNKRSLSTSPGSLSELYFVTTTALYNRCWIYTIFTFGFWYLSPLLEWNLTAQSVCLYQMQRTSEKEISFRWFHIVCAEIRRDFIQNNSCGNPDFSALSHPFLPGLSLWVNIAVDCAVSM